MLKPEKVIVESRGIRHWVQMTQARSEGVSMNLSFQMPSAFIWELSREILGSDAVPGMSPYGEAALSWRIDSILDSDEFLAHPAAAKVNGYWRNEPPQKGSLKRYQLACSLASLFEQYILFRPDWVHYWQKGVESPDREPGLSGLPVGSEDEQWQGHLWRLLAEQVLPVENVHPAMLQAKVLDCMAEKKQLLPEHIYLFGINSLPGSSLDFFHHLACYSHVHLFHLNPCVEYWGDIQSEKARAKASRGQQWHAWLESGDDEVNPLLANLGQQGKRFFNALQKTDHFEISAFELPLKEKMHPEQETVLQCIQQDILSLQNRAGNTMNQVPDTIKQDESIVISSSHSSLREIQALHDYLLHQFNQYPDLTPRDILVTCPDIEHYAPYIDAVFRRPWHRQDDNESPRLPCSIADRVTLEEEPLINAFLDVLTLPDSRFEVNRILDCLRLPAVQQKFAITMAELDTMEWWLQEACVHWGVDANNKAALAKLHQASAMFTWEWGLQRLLLGFSHGDSETVVDGRLLLPHVEGQNAVFLGRLVHLLNRLRFHSQQLKTKRTAVHWQQYLRQLKDDLFQPAAEEENASRIIDEAINKLADATFLAGYDAEIDYVVVQSYLNHCFAIPDSGNNFMTGQITFCSMVPMRSIPFKVIAVLGLNDGDFPRQDKPVSFDLLKKDSLRPGDRSRRADDRYLFLETLVSARRTLYLSYQGRDVKNNEERQPSLVLKELMNYLERGYGWCEKKSYIYQQPLQPFNPACFSPPRPGFDKQWCRLAFPLEDRDNRIRLTPMAIPEEPVEMETLVRFYDDPLKWFGQNRLNLFLESKENRIEDVEPFEPDVLVRYQITGELLKSLVEGRGSADDSTGEFVGRLLLSGRLPETPATAACIENIRDEVRSFYDSLSALGGVEIVRVRIPVAGVVITADIPWQKEKRRVVLYRAAKRKAKDEFRLWLMHLIANIHFGTDDGPITSLGVFYSPTQHGVVKLCSIQNSLCSTPPPGAEDECEESGADRDFDAKAELEKLVHKWLHTGSAEPVVWHSVLGRNATGLPLDLFASEVTMQLENNLYFRWFFASEYTPVEADLVECREIHAPLYHRLNNVKNAGKGGVL